MIIELILSNIPAIMSIITLASIIFSKESFFKKVERQTLRWMVGVLFLWGGLSHLIIPEKAPFQPAWIHPTILFFLSYISTGTQSAVTTPSAIFLF